MTFVLAFDEAYIRMGKAVINAIHHYHDSPSIFLYTTYKVHPCFLELASTYPNLEIIPFKNRGYHFGDWHPLIWAKIEAFGLDVKGPIIFLDADMIIYKNLEPFVNNFSASGRLIGASTDFAPLVKQFNSGLDFRQYFYGHLFKDRAYLPAPAFNAGA